MTAEHAVNHVASVAGVTLTIYAVWSLLLDPATGPLPGTLAPLVVGLLALVIGLSLFAWGSYRIYAEE